MVNITIDIPDQLEERLRMFTHRKGDLKRISAEAFTLWVEQAEQTQKNKQSPADAIAKLEEIKETQAQT